MTRGMREELGMEIQKRNPGPKLTLKQRVWLKHYLTTFNGTAAARAAGYQCKKTDSFETIGHENYVKLQPLIAQWISEVGLTPEKIKLKIVQGLEAKETRRIKLKGAVKQESLPEGRRLIATSGTLAHDKEGGEVFGDGDSVIEWEEEALGIQQRYVEMAAKVLSLFDSDLTGRVERLEQALRERKANGER
jgi:hypothetical protein